MLLPLVLIAGCIVWIVNEILELAPAGPAELVISTAILSNVLLALGIWTFWQDRDSDGVSRAGTLLCSAGMLIFTFRSTSLIMGGTRPDQTELGSTPTVLYGAAALAVGTIALGLWILRRRVFPAWMGAGLVGLTLATLAATILPAPPILPGFINLVLALLLAGIGRLALDRARLGD